MPLSSHGVENRSSRGGAHDVVSCLGWNGHNISIIMICRALKMRHLTLLNGLNVKTCHVFPVARKLYNSNKVLEDVAIHYMYLYCHLKKKVLPAAVTRTFNSAM